jgi:Fe-S oxidoreductase
MLDERRAALETCGYCPKLCRSACPVSEVEASEALIPWGKMAITWYAARGDVAPDRELSELPYACTGCFACRELCEHKNPVAETLRAARAAYRDRGFAAAGAVAAEERRRVRAAKVREAARAFSQDGAGTALLVGCGYVAGAGDEVAEAVHVARSLLGPVSFVSSCCGLVAREAGDAAGADE